MSLNKLQLIGFVGNDPEVLTSQGRDGSQQAVVKFSVATNERSKDKNGDVVEETEWHSIVLFRNNAAFAEKYLKKGMQVFVEGPLRSRKYTDQQGAEKRYYEVLCNQLMILGKKGEELERENRQSQSQYQQKPQRQAYQNSNVPEVYAVSAAPAQAPIPAQPPVDDEGVDDLPF